MTLPVDVLSGAAMGAMWAAFNRQGLWTPAAEFVTTAVVKNGDTQIRVNALLNDGAGVGTEITTNMFEPIRTPLPGAPGAGFAKLLRIDPGGVDLQFQIRRVDPFLTDAGAGDLIIFLEKPFEGLIDPASPAPPTEIAIGAEIAMGHSPVLSVGSHNRTLAILAVSHGFDDDPAGVNARTVAPVVDINMFMSDNQKGPFVDLGPLPGGATFGVATGFADVLALGTFVLPAMAFLKFIAVRNGGDDRGTIFSLYVSRGVQQ